MVYHSYYFLNKNPTTTICFFHYIFHAYKTIISFKNFSNLLLKHIYTYFFILKVKIKLKDTNHCV